MNYKARLIFLFIGLFLLIITFVLMFIYLSFANLRKIEFYDRLEDKSRLTARLMVEIKDVDRSLLRIIDQYSINKMFDEKVLIFNEDNILIYSSLEDEPIEFSDKILNDIRYYGDIYFTDDDDDEVVGIHYTEQGKDYVILASAYDQYGKIHLNNLQEIIIISLLIGLFFIFFISYYYIKQIFRPIDNLNNSIKNIHENNLKEFIPVKKNKKDELDQLANNYNSMLSRLHKAFQSHQSFVRNAAHELKTPLAQMQSKLETITDVSSISTKENQVKDTLHSLMDDIKKHASLVESLLLIQRLQSKIPIQSKLVRVDELLFESIESLKIQYKTQNIEVDISSSIDNEKKLSVYANSLLLKTCFKNLMENASLHGEDNHLSIKMSFSGNMLQIDFQNKGSHPLPKESIFTPFYRHANEKNKKGSGLGLSIIENITKFMEGEVDYRFENKQHVFSVYFSSVV